MAYREYKPLTGPIFCGRTGIEETQHTGGRKMSGTSEETTLMAYIDPVAGTEMLTGFNLVWRFEAAAAPERQAEAIATMLQAMLTVGGIETGDPVRREDPAHYVSFAFGCGAEPAPHDTWVLFSESDRTISIYCHHHEGSWRETIDHFLIGVSRLFAWTVKFRTA